MTFFLANPQLPSGSPLHRMSCIALSFCSSSGGNISLGGRELFANLKNVSKVSRNVFVSFLAMDVVQTADEGDSRYMDVPPTMSVAFNRQLLISCRAIAFAA